MPLLGLILRVLHLATCSCKLNEPARHQVAQCKDEDASDLEQDCTLLWCRLDRKLCRRTWFSLSCLFLPVELDKFDSF